MVRWEDVVRVVRVVEVMEVMEVMEPRDLCGKHGKSAVHGRFKILEKYSAKQIWKKKNLVNIF